MSDAPSKDAGPDLAWIPDITNYFANPGTGLLDAFSPIDPNGSFLSASHVTSQLVCGGRGTGKSTLLLYRLRYLKGLDDVRCVRDVPPHGFKLPQNSLSIPKNVFFEYSKASSWIALWKTILGALFAFAIVKAAASRAPNNLDDWLAAFGVEAKDEALKALITELFRWNQNPHNECIPDLVHAMLRHRPSSDVLGNVYQDKIKPLLASRNRCSIPDARWVMFVDGIDEACAGTLLASDLTDYIDGIRVNENNVQVLAQDVWAHCQAGYGLAAHSMRVETNGQILAFGTLRNETFNPFVAASRLVKSKIEDFVLEIRHTPQLMRDIFDLNVGLMDKSTLPPIAVFPADSETMKVVRHLCGYYRLHSRVVFPFSENVADFLLRHCFMTPRGLMTLGRAVRSIPISERDDGEIGKWRHPEKVIVAVNRAAIEVFEEYRDSLYPPWDARYEDGFKWLTKNIFSQDEALAVDFEFRVVHPELKVGFFHYLYEAGMVGIPERDAQNHRTQHFNTPRIDERPYRADADFVFLHPAFSAFVLKKWVSPENIFYDRRYVIKPGGAWPEEFPRPKISIRCDLGRGHATLTMTDLQTTTAWVNGMPMSAAQTVLVVLAITHRFYSIKDHRAGPFGEGELVKVAQRLAALNLIPQKLGREKIEVSAFISSFFDRERYGSSSEQPDAIKEAKRILVDSKSMLKIVSRYEADVNHFGLGWVHPRSDSISPHQIEVVGLPTHRFIRAVNAPNCPSLDEGDLD